MYANNACCSWRDFADSLKRHWNLSDKIVWQRAYVAWRKYSATALEYRMHIQREIWIRENVKRSPFQPTERLP